MDVDAALQHLDEIDDALRVGSVYPFGAVRSLCDLLVRYARENDIPLSQDSLAIVDFIESAVKQEQSAFDEYMHTSP